MKQTLVIAYNSGAYGTYIEWILTTISTNIDIVAPFDTKRGHSHGFPGNNIGTVEDWSAYVASDQDFLVARLHPKNLEHHVITDNLELIAKDCRGVIYPYPDHSNKLFILNNWYQKTWIDWWGRQFSTDIDPAIIYRNWPVDSSTDIKDIPTWIRREFLSLYLMPLWDNQLDWYLPDKKWSHPKCQIVLMRDFLYDFKRTMEGVIEFAGITPTKSLDQFVPLHKQMLSLQANAGQDQLCATIVDATLANQEFDWATIKVPLVSEAWIQWELRNRGWEIQCHGLDVFPKNSKDLRTLLLKK